MTWDAIVSAALVVGIIMIVLWVIYGLIRKKNIENANAMFKKMFTSLAVGKTLILSNGLVGTVKKFDDEYVWVEIAQGIEIQALKYSIQKII